MKTALFWDIKQRVVVTSYRRFGKISLRNSSKERSSEGTHFQNTCVSPSRGRKSAVKFKYNYTLLVPTKAHVIVIYISHYLAATCYG